jgi:hypothetical protein
MNNLSGEGLFDERPMTQTSLGRFVLRPISLIIISAAQPTCIELIY